MSGVSERAVEAACEVMHDAYEAAAVEAGWQTQERSRKPWSELPEANKDTMRAAVSALMAHLALPAADEAEGDEREALAAALWSCEWENDWALASVVARGHYLNRADAVLAAGFRRRNPDAGLRQRVEALASCCCNTGPGTEGPIQECPDHGDKHARFFLGTLLRATLAADTPTDGAR